MQQLLLKILAIDKIHDQIKSIVPIKVFANFRDRAMIERLEPLRLVGELLTRALGLIDQFFERIRIVLAKKDVIDLRNRADPTASDYIRDAVTIMDNRANRQRVIPSKTHRACLPSARTLPNAPIRAPRCVCANVCIEILMARRYVCVFQYSEARR